jgi:hypothetical protein
MNNGDFRVSWMLVERTAGPTTTLRSGRDDHSIAGVKYFSAVARAAITELSSRPERTRISYFAALATTTDAVSRKGNRMTMIKATDLDRKSGERSGGTCGFFPGTHTLDDKFAPRFGKSLLEIDHGSHDSLLLHPCCRLLHNFAHP